MSKFIMMVGLPGSGKSWNAKNILKELPAKNNCKIFSSDMYRKILFGDERCQNDNELVFKMLYNDMIKHLKNGYDAIFDATNTTLKGRLNTLNILRNNKLFNKVEKTCYIVNTEFSTCVKRDEEREKPVGYSVIKKFLNSFQCPQYFEGWNYIKINELPEDDWYAYELVNQILDKMDSFDQKNPHHIYSLGEHCKQVHDIFHRQNDIIKSQAGLWHDLGKLYTQHFDEYGVAHYYHHDCVGAYQILCNLEFLPSLLNINEKLDVIFYINYHMRAHKDYRTAKAYNKYSQIFSKNKLDSLIEFADADIEASGVKDY